MRKVFALVSCLVLLGALTGCTIGGKEIVFETSPTGFNDVFMVGETACSIKQAKLYLCNYKSLYGSAYGVNLWDYDFEGESLEQYVKDITLDELTKVVCMDMVALQQGIELTEKEEGKLAKAAKEYYESLSEDEKAYMEVSESDVLEIYKNYALAEKLYTSLTQGVNTEVSDDDARVIKIIPIIVGDQMAAGQVKEMIANGDDFATIASTYSTSSASEITVARGELPPEVEAVAFELDNDEISDVVMADGNYYFIKCINKLEEELTEANKGNILIEREKEQFNTVYEEFVGNATFELNEEIWDSIVIDKDLELTTDSFFELYDKYLK